MKYKILALFISFSTTCHLHAQISRNIEVRAGKLDSIISQIKAKNVTKLSLRGTMDARDFRFIRDSLTQIQELDLSNINILSYSGRKGTDHDYCKNYNKDELPNYALYSYSYSILRKLKLPQTLKSIGYRALRACFCLVEIDIPETVNTIQSDAFSYCTNLRKIKLPSGLTQISRGLFDGCDNLKSIEIPHNVIIIGFRAFEGCEAITKIDLPNTVTHISSRAFYGCSGLKEIIIPSQVSLISKQTFSYCTNLRSIVLPNSLKEIHEEAFKCCSNLVIDKLPNSVDYISNGAFGKCLFINIEKNNPRYLLEDSVLYSKDKTRLLLFPISKKDTYTVPASVKRIDICAFYGNKLNTINIQAKIDSIDKETFMNCQSLETISLPGSVKKIKDNAFNGCIKLSNLKLPEKLEKIHYGVFNNCPLLKELYIPASVSLIYYDFRIYAKVDSQNLFYSSEKGVLFDKQKETLLSCPIDMNGTYSIPSTVSYIQSGGGFEGCNQLDTIYISEAQKNGDFSNCSASIFVKNKNEKYSSEDVVKYNKDKTSLLHVPTNFKGTFNVLPSVKTIWKAFYNANGIKKVILPEGVTYLSDGSFYNCSNLDSIYFPSTINFIDKETFTNCNPKFVSEFVNKKYTCKNGLLIDNINKDLMKAFYSPNGDCIIPKTVISINYNAFKGSKNTFRSITIPPTLKYVNNNGGFESLFDPSLYGLFEDVDTKNCILYIPKGQKKLYKNSPIWKSFKSIKEY